MHQAAKEGAATAAEFILQLRHDAMHDTDKMVYIVYIKCSKVFKSLISFIYSQGAHTTPLCCCEQPSELMLFSAYQGC